MNVKEGTSRNHQLETSLLYYCVFTMNCLQLSMLLALSFCLGAILHSVSITGMNGAREPSMEALLHVVLTTQTPQQQQPPPKEEHTAGDMSNKSTTTTSRPADPTLNLARDKEARNANDNLNVMVNDQHNLVSVTNQDRVHLTMTLEQALRDRNVALGNTAQDSKPYLLHCSNQRSSVHLTRMYFPNGIHEIAYDQKKMSELPPWNATVFLALGRPTHSKCLEHPYYVEAVKRRQASPLLAEVAPYHNTWVGGVHWPAQNTSGMRLLQDRPMLIELLGEVFWRKAYGPTDHVDAAIFRAKEDPRPGCLTIHDVQGVSHRYRAGVTAYTQPLAKALWLSRNITENPFHYDPNSNHKGFCALVTKSIYHPRYELDVLIRNVMLSLVNEYKPCIRPDPDDCPGGDLNSHACLSGYKFAISMDNTQLDGYVSEKVFSGKLAGGVTVYSGAPDLDQYVNTKSIVWCELNATTLQEFRSFREKGPRGEAVFLPFDRQPMRDVNATKLLEWATEYLRPHLAHCVDRIIALDQDDEAYNAIRNEPLVTDPAILEGYATFGLGLAYNFLTTAKSPTQQ